MRPADDRAVTDGADAELRGDAAEAFQRHRSVPMFRQSTHGDRLWQLADLGDRTPGWMVNRWVTIQARRRMWTGGDPLAANRVLQLVVPLLYPEAIPFERIGCEYVEQVLPYIYERDWAVRQVDVYDLGGLSRVVELHASEELLRRTDQIGGWCHAPMRACRVERVDPQRTAPTVLTDLTDGRSLEILDLGAPVEAGQHVLARLVPVNAGPGLMFDSAPLPVAAPVAEAVAEAPARWLPTLHSRTVKGDLAPGDTHRPEASMTSDLPYRAWLSMVGVPLEECPDHDPRPLVAEAVEHVLRLAGEGIAAVGPQRHLVAELVLDPLFDEPFRWRFVGPERRDAWQLLSEVIGDPAGSTCAQLALWCAASPDRPDAIA